MQAFVQGEWRRIGAVAHVSRHLADCVRSERSLGLRLRRLSRSRRRPSPRAFSRALVTLEIDGTHRLAWVSLAKGGVGRHEFIQRRKLAGAELNRKRPHVLC